MSYSRSEILLTRIGADIMELLEQNPAQIITAARDLSAKLTNDTMHPATDWRDLLHQFTDMLIVQQKHLSNRSDNGQSQKAKKQRSTRPRRSRAKTRPSTPAGQPASAP